ncbi:hypothetical protein [Lactococcus fujiensis]|uniref:hypothetical protein n=1 Tax=Lactococcus fujiensis TaxID=610251 RepID=UPI000A9C1BD3|nr:hypothetical protein [Lactococcus fujiensis]
MYYFNSWNSEFKQPFGAIKTGEVMKVNFSSDKENVTIKFIIRRDFGLRHEFDMHLSRKDFTAHPFNLMSGMVFIFIILKLVNSPIGGL